MLSLKCVRPGELEYEKSLPPRLAAGMAIIKIMRVGICGTDLHAFQGTQPYFVYPRILGHELSGTIVEVDGTEEFKPGESVTIIPYFNCGNCMACRSGKPNCCVLMSVFGVHQDGGLAEFISVPVSSLVHGDELGFAELALIEPLAIGAHGVRRAGIKKDDFVLVIGAGPIGLSAMDFARIAGAEVIAMDRNESRLKFCRDQIGVTHVINANDADVAAQIQKLTHDEMPAVVIDATGNLTAINNGFRFISQGGKYVLIGLQKGDICFSHPEFHKREASLMSSRNATRQDFTHVMNSIREGLISPKAYINRYISFKNLKDEFSDLFDESSGLIKAMVKFS